MKRVENDLSYFPQSEFSTTIYLMHLQLFILTAINIHHRTVKIDHIIKDDRFQSVLNDFPCKHIRRAFNGYSTSKSLLVTFHFQLTLSNYCLLSFPVEIGGQFVAARISNLTTNDSYERLFVIEKAT